MPSDSSECKRGINENQTIKTRILCILDLLGAPKFIKKSDPHYLGLGVNDTHDSKLWSSKFHFAFQMYAPCLSNADEISNGNTSYCHQPPSHGCALPGSPGLLWAAQSRATPGLSGHAAHGVCKQVCPEHPCHGMSAGHLPGESTAGKWQG